MLFYNWVRGGPCQKVFLLCSSNLFAVSMLIQVQSQLWMIYIFSCLEIRREILNLASCPRVRTFSWCTLVLQTTSLECGTNLLSIANLRQAQLDKVGALRKARLHFAGWMDLQHQMWSQSSCVASVPEPASYRPIPVLQMDWSAQSPASCRTATTGK